MLGYSWPSSPLVRSDVHAGEHDTTLALKTGRSTCRMNLKTIGLDNYGSAAGLFIVAYHVALEDGVLEGLASEDGEQTQPEVDDSDSASGEASDHAAESA